MPIHLEPEDLETEAGKIRTMADDFDGLVAEERDSVLDLPWDGASREAFVDLFEEAKVEFETHVSPKIRAIGDALDGAKNALVEQDEHVATTIRG